MRNRHLPTTERGNFPALATLVFCLAATLATTAAAAANEDSLVCAKVKDSYAAAVYTAAFWARSEAYGEMSWCDMQVKAVEHCVPIEPVLHDTTAPYEGFRGPEIQTEYTCYRIRCMNGQGRSYMGTAVAIDDMFGARTGGRPEIMRVCIPNR